MENLLKHKLEKMLIFDQKILEVAIVPKLIFQLNSVPKLTFGALSPQVGAEVTRAEHRLPLEQGLISSECSRIIGKRKR